MAAEYRWYLSQYIPISNEKGEIYAVQICSVDITDRKKAEDHLDELQADLIALIENTEDIIVFRDIEGRVKIYNKACKEITRKLFDVEIEEGMRTTRLSSCRTKAILGRNINSRIEGRTDSQGIFLFLRRWRSPTTMIFLLIRSLKTV